MRCNATGVVTPKTTDPDVQQAVVVGLLTMAIQYHENSDFERMNEVLEDSALYLRAVVADLARSHPSEVAATLAGAFQAKERLEAVPPVRFHAQPMSDAEIDALLLASTKT